MRCGELMVGWLGWQDSPDEWETASTKTSAAPASRAGPGQHRVGLDSVRAALGSAYARNSSGPRR